MIVTLMFAQAGYLAILYFGAWTRGDEGFTLARAARALGPLDLSADGPRYAARLRPLRRRPPRQPRAGPRARPAACSSPSARTPSAPACSATTPSATACSPSPSPASTPAPPAPPTASCFGYVGATFASIQYSILPLLWVLLGGAGTVLGPLVGTALMFYLRRPRRPRHRRHAPRRRPRASSPSSSSPRAACSARCAPGPCRGCRDPARGPRPHPPLRRPARRRRTSTSTSPPARSTR